MVTQALAKFVQPAPVETVKAAPVYQPIDRRSAQVLADAQLKRDLLAFAERMVTHPIYATIAGATLVEQLRKSGTIGQNIAVPLQAAIFTPTFLKALADATSTGFDIAKLIAMFAK